MINELLLLIKKHASRLLKKPKRKPQETLGS